MIPLVIGSFAIILLGVCIIGGYEDDKELKTSIFLISLGMFGLIVSAILSFFL